MSVLILYTIIKYVYKSLYIFKKGNKKKVRIENENVLGLYYIKILKKKKKKRKTKEIWKNMNKKYSNIMYLLTNTVFLHALSKIFAWKYF